GFLSRRRRRRARASAGRDARVARRRRLARRPAPPGTPPVIDLKRLRDEPSYRAGIERKRVAPDLVDQVLAADARHRALLQTVEDRRARQNAASKEIGRAPADERPALVTAAAALKDELASAEHELAEEKEGFTPVVPPVLVREHAMVEAGFFPTDRNQVYEVDGGELFLVGTSEVPLSALHRGEILDPDDLPRRYLGISSCFRREAGTHGKDTTGIFRVHQFDKVEMFSFAEPEGSADEHEALLAIEERIVSGLGLPYRVVNIAAGDLGAAA